MADLPALRPYQVEIKPAVHAAVAAGRRRILLVAPTGAGKTVIAADFVREARDAGQRVLFLAHRRELITQADRKLFERGVDAGMIQAGFTARPDVPVQVASVQTLYARAVITSKIDMPHADLVVVDEAHHIRAGTYRQIVDSYPDAIVLGITATPLRRDGRGLGNVFDVMLECPQVPQLIEQGYLVATRVYAPTIPDLKGVRVEKGDYVHAALEQRMDQPQLVGDIISHWLRLAERRKTVVFASGVGHSAHLRAEFIRAGVRAAHIDGATPKEERDGILRRLSAGDLDLVTNFGVLTEGWDQPDVACAVLARPTKHMGLYRQMVGRVLRPSAGKDHALILDHAGLVFAHGFVEEPISWTLDQDRRAHNPTHAARDHGPVANRLATCPACTAVRLGGKPCGACGWAPKPTPKHVDVQDGELARIDRSGRQDREHVTIAERARFHAMLVLIARDRGYKPGWAAFKHKEKFGAWPDARHVMPIEPDATVRSWVRSRQIAYAKAMDKRRGAA